jgi:hypothetical protein
MLDLLLSLTLAFAPQGAGDPAWTGAVAVRGEAELTPAAALASATARVEEHVRQLWGERAERLVRQSRPFWLPECLTAEPLRRWLCDLETDRLVRFVDREDREREHDFGASYQTTIWVAEDPSSVQRGERRLRSELRRLERSVVARYGGVAVAWVVLFVLLGWVDRLSRGYMTGRLWFVGLLGGAAVPVVAFLV